MDSSNIASVVTSDECRSSARANYTLSIPGGQRSVLFTWSVHGRCYAAEQSTAAETRMGVHDEKSKKADDGILTANCVGPKLRDSERLMPK